MSGTESHSDTSSLSKRAARRLIQRAWVLTGRDRRLRQHIRELKLTTLWTIEDWGLAWTVFFERGRIEFDRRPAKRPHATFAWPSAEAFFARLEGGSLLEVMRAEAAPADEPAEAEGAGRAEEERVRRPGRSPAERALEPVCRVFADMLREVLENPFDENGDPLV